MNFFKTYKDFVKNHDLLQSMGIGNMCPNKVIHIK